MTTRRVPLPRRVDPSTPEPEEAATPTAEVLGERYELGELLGVGGVARVVRARDLVLHRDVAIKLFGPGIDPSGPERERAEMRTLASLSHPNLVPLHDAGTDHEHVPPRAFLVMALVDGHSLAEQLRSGPLPETQVRSLGAQVADALACVHSSGVVHRDVKPANILIDRSGRPFLTDFGIARAVGAAALTAVGDTVGTAAYLSPEQVRGQEAGPPTDVYALGLVLLEALTGAREYAGSTAETALARLTRPPRISESVPADLRELLAQMTAAEASARPSAEAVASRLATKVESDAATRVLRSTPPAAGAEPPVDGTRLLTTAMSTSTGTSTSTQDVLGRGQELLRETWSKAPPWASERRNVVFAALAVLALLFILVIAAAAQGPSGSDVRQPPAGNPGPSRLSPDLDRLDELVQP
ncbi:MAG: serine/threonine protein kinase [Actinomycetota bacterium]|nr:serine/threonine protein kinase [Actinomycetota bacterium]